MKSSLMMAASAMATLFYSGATLKVGLISDMHLNLHYDASLGTDEKGKGDCVKGSGVFDPIHAPMGRYGCDSPTVMIENMIQAFLKKEGK